MKPTSLVAVALSLCATIADADPIADAMADVQRNAGAKTEWDGPTTGPAAIDGASIIVIAGNLANGGIAGVNSGIGEAAEAIGWNVTILDGAGTPEGRKAALGEALAAAPSGLILNGFDASEQSELIANACATGIPIVSWHAGPVIGPDEGNCLFANISTDPLEVSIAAAQWAFADAGGAPGVVVFTDSTYEIAIAKADTIAETITALGGLMLDYVDTPIADAANQMPGLTERLLADHGESWTHALAINDVYFDYMGGALEQAGIAGDGAPTAVAAGDGSASAYGRIREGNYQAVTVAEPLNLQGWQLIDELNRAMNKQPWSGYVPPIHVVTQQNIAIEGGPENAFDPGNGYRAQYMAVWAPGTN